MTDDTDILNHILGASWRLAQMDNREGSFPRIGGIMLQQYRFFLKDSIRLSIDFSTTDQNRNLPAPPIEKPAPPDALRVGLVQPGSWKGISPVSVEAAIGRRTSRRVYSTDPLNLDELSFLLWSTQGIRGPVTDRHAYRTVPSAGCRHAFETYVAAFRVLGLEKAIYRYLPLSHELVLLSAPERLESLVARAALNQDFAGKSAATFFWTTVPLRMEWRYGLAAHKVIALDAGHVCQNLYLACEAIGAGTCAIAAYDQEGLDRLLGVDGEEEFAIYLAPVGKRPAGGQASAKD
jgi:SagB-type dehydrogenase family enzyme